jgi:hypothetical protein
MSTRLSRVLAVLLLSVTLTACSGDEDAAREAAEQLAEGLASYDVSKVPATDKAAATELDEVLKALDRFDSTVEVDDVTVEDDTATATLQGRTQVGEKSWTRTARAELVKGQDEWRYRPEPALVAEGLQEGDTLRVSTLKAERGRILGQDDAPLVRPRPVLRVGIDKTKVPAGRAVASARALAKVLDIDAKRFADQVKAAGPKAFVEGLVLRRADLPNDYGLRYADIPGAVGLSDTSRSPRPGRSRRRSWAPWGRRPPSWSRRATAGSPPATRPDAPGCSCGTTSSWPAPRASGSVPCVARTRPRSSSPSTPSPARTCRPPSTRACSRTPTTSSRTPGR